MEHIHSVKEEAYLHYVVSQTDYKNRLGEERLTNVVVLKGVEELPYVSDFNGICIIHYLVSYYFYFIIIYILVTHE